MTAAASVSHPNGPATLSKAWPSKYPPVPNATAHAIPPSALKSRNCNGGKRLTPASTAANTRSTATKRPRKTILPPCRRKRYSPRSRFRWSKPNKCPHLSNPLAPSFGPEPVADIVAKNCRGCRCRNNQPYVQRIMRACVNSRANENGFSRQGDAGALEQDNPENRNIPIRRNEFVEGCLIQK